MGVAKVLHRYCIAVAQVLHRCLIDVALWFFHIVHLLLHRCNNIPSERL